MCDEYEAYEESKRDWLADEKASMEPERCRKCGGTSFEARHKGSHIGWYCTKCGAWLRWIPQHNKKAQLNEPHQMSIEEFMQETAPEQATMKSDNLPWEE